MVEMEDPFDFESTEVTAEIASLRSEKAEAAGYSFSLSRKCVQEAELAVAEEDEEEIKA